MLIASTLGNFLAALSFAVLTSPATYVADELVITASYPNVICPAETTVALSPGSETITITFGQYTARVGVGAAATDVRKNCSVNILFQNPEGISYAIGAIDFHGSLHLEPGATGALRQAYYAAGIVQTAYTITNFTGPIDGELRTTVPAQEPLLFTPCGDIWNRGFNTELRVAAGSSDPSTTTSSVSLSSVDGAPSVTYHLVRKECTTP